MLHMETLEFALLKLSIFLPHQTFHITTPLEVDFGSVQGLQLYRKLTGEMTAEDGK